MNAPTPQQEFHDPFVMIIFGATGDLTQRKLIPALFSLFQDARLPKDFMIIGCARRDIGRAGWQQAMMAGLADKDRATVHSFTQHLQYHQLDFGKANDYHSLARIVQEYDAQFEQCGRQLFHLATPADQYAQILHNMAGAGLIKPANSTSGWTRVILEKPFGHDGASAKKLEQQLSSMLHEDQIFRIDHYLAKETVQNLFAFRFANSLFEPIWNHDHIERIEISMTETLGAEGRGAFYDRTGALRDVLQNHLLQLLALITMNEPASMDSNEVRDKRAQIMNHLKLADATNPARSVTIGQYKGYLDEPNVTPASKTETFVAVKATIHTARWKNTSIYLITGKGMDHTCTQIKIYLRRLSPGFFTGSRYNVLTFDIQPVEGVSLSLAAKKPGYDTQLEEVIMHFDYALAAEGKQVDAYSRLLVEAMRGEQTLFTRSDEIAAEWKFVDPIEKQFANVQPLIYPRGSSLKQLLALAESND